MLTERDGFILKYLANIIRLEFPQQLPTNNNNPCADDSVNKIIFSRKLGLKKKKKNIAEGLRTNVFTLAKNEAVQNLSFFRDRPDE